jgi:hypothetical protein
MNMPNSNHIAVKVMKSTDTGSTSPSQHAKFPTIAKDMAASKIEALHPKVKMEADSKPPKIIEPIKMEPKTILIPKENGIFEIQVTCSCGEVHQIQCETISDSTTK